jgi:hypothetical protein
MIDIRDIGIIKQRHHIKDDGLGHVATWSFTSRHILKQSNESHLFSPTNLRMPYLFQVSNRIELLFFKNRHTLLGDAEMS